MRVLEKRVEIETHATYNVGLMGCWINGVSEESGEIPSCLVQPTGESPATES